MKEVILLYSTDAWHSHSSRELVGVFSCPYKLKSYFLKMKKANRLTDEDLKMLAEHNQTQGNHTNYLIETEKVNPQYDNKNEEV